MDEQGCPALRKPHSTGEQSAPPRGRGAAEKTKHRRGQEEQVRAQGRVARKPLRPEEVRGRATQAQVSLQRHKGLEAGTSREGPLVFAMAAGVGEPGLEGGKVWLESSILEATVGVGNLQGEFNHTGRLLLWKNLQK